MLWYWHALTFFYTYRISPLGNLRAFFILKKTEKKLDLYLKGVGETPSEVELWYHETLNKPDQAGGG